MYLSWFLGKKVRNSYKKFYPFYYNYFSYVILDFIRLIYIHYLMVIH